MDQAAAARAGTAARRAVPRAAALPGPVLALVLALGAPAAGQPATDHEMPFPCGQSWTGTTRPGHSPSTRAIDWNRADDLGDPVVATAPGVVATADATSTRGYGRYVVLDHGSGESTVYAHLDTVAVTAGQRVDQGAQLGTVGSTGNSTGPHLHFEEKVGGQVVEAWFGGRPFAYGETWRSTNCVDVPLAGNLLGSRPAERVVYRRAARSLFLVQREGREPKTMRLGTATDQPVLGDWDGNGKANLGVYTPATATFTLRAGRTATTTVVLGAPGDQPVAGDWDGDGTWEVGVRSPATGTWTLRHADGSTTSVALGSAPELPVTGDWDGDGRTDLGVYDTATATFTLRRVDREGLAWTAQVSFGDPGDLPVAGDWDGNATTDVGVWDPATATFTERRSPTATAARVSTSSGTFGRPR